MEFLLLATLLHSALTLSDEVDTSENHIDYFFDPKPPTSTSFPKANLFLSPFLQNGFNLQPVVQPLKQQPQNYFPSSYTQNEPDCVCGLGSVATGAQRKPRASSSRFSIELDDGRVVGGIEAVAHSLPWMAILASQQRNYAPFCGGSIISDRYIITAAHCHDNKMPIEDVKVIIGEHDRCIQDKVTSIFSVDKLIVHPSFRNTDFFADIMLLRLSMKITFNRVIRPICLPPPGSSYENNWAIVSGWGTQNSNGSLQCSLKQATIPILSQQDCVLKSKYPPNAVHATLFCAGLLPQGGRDSCQGDSGGPLQLVHPRSRRFTLVGIVSNGIGCGLPDYPGLYTTVSKFIGWIAATTQDSAYCIR